MAWRLNDNPWSNTDTWSGSSSIFVGAPREHDVVAWTNVDRFTDMLQWACVSMREAFLAVEIHGPKARGAFFPDEDETWPLWWGLAELAESLMEKPGTCAKRMMLLLKPEMLVLLVPLYSALVQARTCPKKDFLPFLGIVPRPLAGRTFGVYSPDTERQPNRFLDPGHALPKSEGLKCWEKNTQVLNSFRPQAGHRTPGPRWETLRVRSLRPFLPPGKMEIFRYGDPSIFPNMEECNPIDRPEPT
ncbi:hypothetical protein DY000_02052907 [Brassica cretica]|uniref:Uncharacterized protein n=1 Tax=Brassica cretica TaxID=69181 RepID=A0ABQ7A6J6_BRACR|nr:hypothetical protein DY000_02052907 [Brassica cretica]